MGLKLTVLGRASGPVDVDVDAPGETTIGALAARLADRSVTGSVTLTVPPGGAVATNGERPSATDRALDPTTRLDTAGLRSGSTVQVVAVDPPAAPSDAGAPATATAVTGPDAGRRFALRAGTHLIGRDRSCDIVLTDESVSRRHVRLDVGERVEVVDLGSANGTIVSGERVTTATVDAATTIRIGATDLRIDVAPPPAPLEIAFVRSPPERRAFTPEEIAAPKVPMPAKPGRIPAIAALAPVVLGLVMFAVTGQAQSLLFVLLSPLMLLANAGEARWSNRRGAKRSITEYRTALGSFAMSSRERLANEAAARRDEHPDVAHLVAALEHRTPLLWSRRPDEPHFAELSVGRARQPARTTFTTGRTDGAPADLVAELDAVVDPLRTIDDVPVAVDLADTGSIGIAGPSIHAGPIAATTVASAVMLHSPAELTVTLFSSEASANDWEWLTWLPHVDARSSPFDGRHLAASAASCAALHAALLQLLEAREQGRGRSGDARHVPAVLMVVDDEAPIDRALLVDLLERGPAAGIHAIWTASVVERLPAGCGAIVDTRRGPESLSVRTRRTNEVIDEIHATVLTPAELDRVARLSSPLVDVGARTRRATGLPDSVAGPDLLGLPPDPAPEMLIERWNHTSIDGRAGTDGGLRAPVGVAADEPFVLDLRTHGPHALVGGTTGAGKSEFLQSWVMGLAASYGPARVNFLFVDYKGGAAFSECVKLPHCVGLVTDLSPHLVDRALTSLHAELHRREQLFNSLDAKDIHELERRGAAETPPALVIVVDEFAALVQEVPDFVTGVVNVAQRGRSLGLHLVLATQRPAGVITGNLRANTNLRVALRMADESDSADVIDAPDAAFIDAGNPGRGYAKFGPGRTFAFQSAYYGGWSGATAADHAITIRPLSVRDAEPWPTQRDDRSRIDDPNDLARLVNAVQRAALLGHQPAPRRPWLPELPANLDLREAPLTRSDGEIVLGVRDLPSEQAQPPLSYFPDRDGNLVVFGASGSGKSTLLRTIAMVAGALDDQPAPTDGPCHVYCIDFGSRSLQLLEDFPHVGAVIAADDHERISRLIRELRSTIDARQATFRAADADSISQYRERTGSRSEPRILLLIDNFGAFRQAYDVPGRDAILGALTSIMSDGRPVGVHVVVSADRPGAVPSSVTSLITRRLALRLSNESDYLLIGEPATVLDHDTPAGRGLEGGREFQVAVLGGTTDLAEQTRLARALARHRDFGGARAPAPPVRTLPTSVSLDDLPPTVGRLPTLGVDDATLQPVGLEPRGAFVVAGPPGSGRTTAMGTLALSLRRAEPRFQRVLFAGRRSPLLRLTEWTTVAERPAEHAELATAITADLNAVDGDVTGLAIFIEDAPELLEAPEAANALGELVKSALAADAFLVVDGDASVLARAWKLDAIKNQRTGLLLQPRAGDGDVLKVALPRTEPGQFPAGRGMLVGRRDVSTVQVAHVELPH